MSFYLVGFVRGQYLAGSGQYFPNADSISAVPDSIANLLEIPASSMINIFEVQKKRRIAGCGSPSLYDLARILLGSDSVAIKL